MSANASIAGEGGVCPIRIANRKQAVGWLNFTVGADDILPSAIEPTVSKNGVDRVWKGSRICRPFRKVGKFCILIELFGRRGRRGEMQARDREQD
jgi:hypothetical protein